MKISNAFAFCICICSENLGVSVGSFKSFTCTTILTPQGSIPPTDKYSNGTNMLQVTIEDKQLATANGSRVSIRGRPIKIFLACSLITGQNLVVVSHTMCAHVGGPKILGTIGPAPLGEQGRRPRNTLLPTPNFVTLGQSVWS